MRSLQECNYATVELLLTPLQFGIPNSRLRYYLLAKQRPLKFANTPSDADTLKTVWRHIPGHGEPWEDKREDRDAAQLSLYLDPDELFEDDHPYRIPDRVLLKWGRLFDIVLPSSRRSCCFTRGALRNPYTEGDPNLKLMLTQDIHSWWSALVPFCR